MVPGLKKSKSPGTFFEIASLIWQIVAQFWLIKPKGIFLCFISLGLAGQNNGCINFILTLYISAKKHDNE